MLTTDNMYSLHNWEKFSERLQTQLSGKWKIISAVFIAFIKSFWNFVYFEKKDQLHILNHSQVIDSEKCSYLNLTSNCFRTPFWSECVHPSQTLPSSAWQHFYLSSPLIQDKLSWETCPQIRSKILGLFVNTLMTDSTYSPRDWEKFPQWLQTQLL